MSSSTSSRNNSAPQLLFDDGSRAIHQEVETSTSVVPGRDPAIDIREYYEIDRIAQELNELRNKNNKAQWQNRIALQFPDALLMDAPDVCWELEQALNDPNALVFCLGDTTYQACCPDVVAAQHLQADCIVHYGHACLVSQAILPVLYSFGKQPIGVPTAVEAVVTAVAAAAAAAAQKQQRQSDPEEDSGAHENILLVYEVQYAHAMQELQKALEPHFQKVFMGKIPSSLGRATGNPDTSSSSSSPLCGQSSCGCSAVKINASEPLLETKPQSPVEPELISTNSLLLGGLEIPPCQDWSKTTLLFIGQDPDSRPLQNMLLRFATDPTHAPAAYWTYNPVTETLVTETQHQIGRMLNRRFYLMQKAKLATVFGILVANPSDATTRPVVQHLQALLQKAHSSGNGDNNSTAQYYNFMVGKVNPHKLANFPEVDAFCLVACPEHAWLQDERRDYAVPILTPLEVAMAVGGVEWGTLPYSLDVRDFLKTTASVVQESDQKKEGKDDDEHEEDEDEDDAPYFNPVTGRYESATRKKDQSVNLQVLPGQGQLSTYQSAAADFLKQRTYKGLTVDAGETAVQAAVPGQKGIASDYSNR